MIESLCRGTLVFYTVSLSVAPHVCGDNGGFVDARLLTQSSLLPFPELHAAISEIMENFPIKCRWG